MRPVLFLDVDGVLNSDRSRSLFGNDHVDPVALDALSRLLEALPGGAHVVLSSTWRLPHLGQKAGDLAAALPFLARLPLHPDAPMTPSLPDAARGDEVLGWLDRQRHDGPFVVLDDLPVLAVLPQAPSRLEALAQSVLLVNPRSGFGTPYHLETLAWMLAPQAQAA